MCPARNHDAMTRGGKVQCIQNFGIAVRSFVIHMLYPEGTNLGIGIWTDPRTCLDVKKPRKILCAS
jgi:hypothetical protein